MSDSNLLAVFLVVVAVISCGWFVFNARKQQAAVREKELHRIEAIESLRTRGVISLVTQQSLIAKKVGIGFTADLVRLAWGEPTKVDQQEITAKGISKERWVYGVGRAGRPASYLFFKNGEVDKIKS
jgi:hypothetical protein